VQDRLYFTGADPQNKPLGEFVLQRGYRRYVYGGYWAPSSGGLPNRYFLTRVESTVQKWAAGPIVLADINYAMPPGLSCAAGGAFSTPGVPYIKNITSADGAVLTFHYKKLTRPPHPAECVIDNISIED